MINYKGIVLPDGERHLQGWMEQIGHMRDGKPTYQHHKYEAARNWCGLRRVAVDVGGNIGLWSRVMALDFERVVAFEPVARYVDCWKVNAAAPNTEVHQVALGEREGVVAMHCPDESTHGNTFVARPDDHRNIEESVPLRTLDSFGLEHVDFLKVDVEGYELPVLQGARRLLEACRPVVIVEQKPGTPFKYGLGQKGAVEFLQGLGAQLRAEMSGDFIFSW